MGPVADAPRNYVSDRSFACGWMSAVVLPLALPITPSATLSRSQRRVLHASQPKIEPIEVALLDGKPVSGLPFCMAFIREYKEVDGAPMFPRSRDHRHGFEILGISRLYDDRNTYSVDVELK